MYIPPATEDRVYKIKMRHSRGHNESTLDGDHLAEWLRDVANNAKADFLIHIEIDLIKRNGEDVK